MQEDSICYNGLLRQYRIIIVARTRRQIFRQVVQKFCRHTNVCQEISVQEVKRVSEKIPTCKLVMLCDENSAPDIAREVANAKKDGLIDAFFYSSVTEKYLTAALASL